MAPRIPEESAEQKRARLFFERRRQGLDGKVRSLILGLSNQYNVDMNVTVIYEFRDQISIFRSHQDDSGKWFPTVKDLRESSINCTDMGHVDSTTRELLKWQARQRQRASMALEVPSTPHRPTRLQDGDSIVMVEEHQARRAGQIDDGDDAAANETDDEDRTDADYPDDSEESDDDDYQLVNKPTSLGSVKKEPSCEELSTVPRQSPKRRRGMMGNTNHGDIPSFPGSSPQSYQAYGQFTGGSPQMQLANSLGTFLPQTGIAPMTVMPHPHNNMTSDNCFYSDVGGLGNFEFGSAPQVVPFRSQSRQDLPQLPKGRTAKRKGRGGARRTKTS